MGWFSEQIKQRIDNDSESFTESLTKMANVVMGDSVINEQMNDRVKQSQDAIETILNYFKIKPQETPSNITDMIDQLEFQLRPSGIMYREIVLSEEWYKDGLGILLGSLDNGDIISLIPCANSGYKYFDRKENKFIKITKKNKDQISTEALCFYKPLPLKKIGIKELLKYLIKIPTKADYLTIVFITFIVTLLGILIPKVNNLIFSYVAVSKDFILLATTIIFLLGVKITTTLINAINIIFTERIKTKMNIYVESASMIRILTLPSSFFKSYSSGNISSRMSAISTLCSLITDSFFSVGLTSLFSLLYIFQIFQYAPSLATPAILITLATLILTIITSMFQFKNGREMLQLEVKEQGMVYSLFTGVNKIKLAGAEKRMFARWANLYSDKAKLKYAPPMMIKYNSVIRLAISLIGTVIMYALAVKNGVQVADYMAFNVSYAMITVAFEKLSSLALTAANIKPILEIAEPILQTVPEIAQYKKNIERLSGGIELNRVSFRYSDTMPLIIDDLTLKIRPGQYVAIVGKTGCGKSTLMRLMLGFETPKKGSIYYDGKDLASLNLKSVRQKIGVVLQEGKLFQGDIYSNIVISNPRLTLDDAWAAAEMAGMAEDIRTMPMGMNTLISEGAGGISGGQRQRLMIARAIAPKPKILMFDEATSALDNITQKHVSESLAKLKCTRIVIAHRLSTIKQCDRIIVLDKGKIIEDGTYSELIEQKGFFAELVARQQVDESQK